MNTHLDWLLATQRVEDARARADRERLVASLRLTRAPLRATLGLALIRAGRWVAGEAPARGVEPFRAGV